MLSNILFRFSTDGNRGAAFSAEVLRKGIADRPNCHNDAVRSSRRGRTDDEWCMQPAMKGNDSKARTIVKRFITISLEQLLPI